MKKFIPAALVICCFMARPSVAQETGDPMLSPLETNRSDLTLLREMMDKRIEVEKACAEEKNQWREGKDLLQQRVSLIKMEIEDLSKKKTESEKSITDAELKKAELLKNKDALVQSLQELRDQITRFEAEIRPLQAWLPDVVKEKVAPLYQRIPEPDQTAKVSLAERYQNVLGILNELSKANGLINIVSEIRTLKDGKPVEVKTLYVGLAQAYYVNVTGKKAGRGQPTEKGWIWEENDNLAGSVQTAIGMLESKTKAHFVAVPVQLKN